jgi:hypothetical protein
MEKMNLNLTQVRDRFDTAYTWVRVHRRTLAFQTTVLLAIISAMLIVMSVGAVIEAFVQAHQPFGLPAPLPAIVTGAAGVINVAGFIALVIFSYFTNLSQQDDNRREWLIDGLVLGMGFLTPQALFHAGWLATTHYIVTSRQYIITTEMLVNINLEWLVTIGLAIINIVMGWFLWRKLHDTRIAYVPDEYVDVEEYQPRRAYQ